MGLAIVSSDGTIKEVKRKTCEYKGIEYFVERDRQMKKNYIEVDRQKLYLNKNGKVSPKQPGVYSTVDFLTVDEVQKMKEVFKKKIEDATTPTNELIAWKNYTLFCCGINVGLRASDLRNLQWKDIYDTKGNRKRGYIFNAEKTGKRTEIAFNDAFFEAIETYRDKLLQLKDKPHAEDYLFFSKKNDKNAIDEKTMWKIMNDAAIDAKIEKNVGSHTLRKTFGRTVYENAENKSEVLIMLQEWFKHSSPMVTLRYIGITFDQMYQMAQSIHL